MWLRRNEITYIHFKKFIRGGKVWNDTILLGIYPRESFYSKAIGAKKQEKLNSLDFTPSPTSILLYEIKFGLKLRSIRVRWGSPNLSIAKYVKSAAHLVKYKSWESDLFQICSLSLELILTDVAKKIDFITTFRSSWVYNLNLGGNFPFSRKNYFQRWSSHNTYVEASWAFLTSIWGWDEKSNNLQDNRNRSESKLEKNKNK